MKIDYNKKVKDPTPKIANTPVIENGTQENLNRKLPKQEGRKAKFTKNKSDELNPEENTTVNTRTSEIVSVDQELNKSGFRNILRSKSLETHFCYL